MIICCFVALSDPPSPCLGLFIQSFQIPVPLNSDDPLFCTVRDVHVEQLMPFLQDKVKPRATVG